MTYVSKMPTVLAFTFIWTVCFVSATGARVLDISNTGNQVYLGPYLEYLEDKNGSLDIHRVKAPEVAPLFKECKRLSPGFGFTSSVYWFKFTLKNSTPKNMTRFLEIEYPLLDHIELYAPDPAGGFKIYKEGDREAFSHRPLKYRNFVFILEIPGNSIQDYFIRVKTSSSLNLPARLYTQDGLIDKIENEETALGIYFGILFAMLSYNLILYFTIRESVYLYYVLFVIFNSLFQLNLTGMAFKYFWPNNVEWANSSLPLFIALAFLFGTIFTRQILNSKKYAPLLDRILWLLQILASVSAAVCLFLPYEISIKAVTLIAITVIFHIIAGFMCLYRGYRPARYYSLAWSVSMAGTAIYALKTFNLLPNNFITVWGIQIGSAWEVILLSMALSDRLSTLQRERDKIQAEYTRKLEEANLRLEEFAKTLEEKVRQRTEELEASNALLKKQAAEMRLAEERAERASKAKSDFLANMSHEIRTPLNAITGITALALEMDIPEKLRGYLKIIKVSTHSLLNLVNDILDLSKIEAGKMELEHTEFKLLEVMDNVADMFTEIVADKGIEFIIDVEPDVPISLVGDPVRLGQLLTNLVSNAIKFTDEGEVVLSCRLISDDGTSVELSFEVKDTGIGIERDRLESLFDMFTQADTSTTRRFGGTGLGLTICKRIAELMGGKISVESVPKEGSTFTFKVSLKKGVERAGRDLLVLDRLKEMRIGVYSENPQLRQSIVHTLARIGAGTVAILDFGGDVVASRLDFDMCILDIVETELASKGPALASILDGIPLVILVPFGMEESYKNIFNAKGVRFSVKPCTASRLARSVKAALGWCDVPEEASEERKEVRFRDLKVLVVEDNEINQKVAQEILERLGAQVDFASNGLEAIEKASPSHDIIFMDIQMPEMDGYQATMRLKERKELDGIPIIAMTAGVFKEDKRRCFEAGMDDFVMKPVTPDAVQKVIKQWVSEDKVILIARDHSGDQHEFPSIPGVNLDEVKRRFSSSPALYLDLLERFVKENRDIASRVEALSLEGEREDLRRLFHTLKGVCANLALTKLQALFLRAEAVSKDGKGELEEIVGHISSAIKEVESALSGLRMPVKRELEGGANNSELKKLIIKLDELLQLNDIECEEVWKQLKIKLAQVVSQEALHELDGLIEELDFDTARERLARVSSML